MDTDVQISAIAPLVCSTLIVFHILLIFLWIKFDTRAVLQLFRRRYLWLILPAAFKSCYLCLCNLAMGSGVSASLLLVMFKLMLLPGMLGERWITQQWPYRTQFLTVLCVVQLVAVHVLITSESSATPTVIGWTMAFLAPTLDYIGSFLLDVITGKLASSAINKVEEKTRCCIHLEAWKFVFQIILLVSLEMQFLSGGILRGWSSSVVLGAVLPVSLMTISFNAALLTVGAQGANIASSLDAGCAYLMEGVFLGFQIRLAPILVIVCIVYMVIQYNQFTRDLRLAAFQRLEMDHAEVGSKLARAVSYSSDHLDARCLPSSAPARPMDLGLVEEGAEPARAGSPSSSNLDVRYVPSSLPAGTPLGIRELPPRILDSRSESKGVAIDVLL
jgi:hypothetical protein